jgi:hypothetical protein
MPSYPDREMTLLKRTRVEDFEEAVVTRPLRAELDHALVRELVDKLDLLSKTEDEPGSSPRSLSRRR